MLRSRFSLAGVLDAMPVNVFGSAAGRTRTLVPLAMVLDDSVHSECSVVGAACRLSARRLAGSFIAYGGKAAAGEKFMLL